MSDEFKTLGVFPGQGSQSPGMGKLWFDNFEVYKKTLEEASDATGLHLKNFPLDTAEVDLKPTAIAQPLILSTSIGIFRALEENFGFSSRVQVPLFAGHSLGEYSALVAAGVLSVGTAARLVHKRGQFMQAAVPPGQGGMRALILKEAVSEDVLQALCTHASKLSQKTVALANWNSDTQVVVSGESAALEVVDSLVGQDSHKWLRRSIPLDVSAPFHSPLMQPAAEQLAAELEVTEFTSSDYFYLRNVDATRQTLRDSDEVKSALVNQVAGNVKWYPSLLLAHELGCRKQIEIGCGKILSNLTARCAALKDWTVVSFEGLSDFKK